MSTKITMKRALELQCHECMGHYSDGKIDCECTSCSLYKWMPYREKEPDFSTFDYNPRRSGKVTMEDSRPNITDEQRKASSDRLKAARLKANMSAYVEAQVENEDLGSRVSEKLGD